MQKNDLLQCSDTVIRILDIHNDMILIIDCIKRTIPKWIHCHELSCYEPCTEAALSERTGIIPRSMEELDSNSRKFAYEHYTMIAGALPFIGDPVKRSNAINRLAEYTGKTKQTIRNLLCLYLAHQTIAALAPKKTISERPLSQDEKNMRWALNKYFYNKNRNSLQTAYTLMLKEKYCNSNGQLFAQYPSIHHFRYFYRKTKSMQTYLISRNGIKDYQRNDRPLVGDGIQEFAPAPGVSMLDATVCDIYLINDAGNLVGRPILTAAIDAYSGFCCGYTLSWEGGVYSLRNLMANVIADKVQWCLKFGIHIQRDDWDCSGALPGVLVTDMGSEYKSENFEQIAELGVTIENLPAYRPELKGAVEKFFDLLQGYFKPHLKGKGVIEPDFQERGAHDYRKDACLTMRDFETIILRCILYYNSQRIVKNFPYTEAMLCEKVQPYANAIWNWGKQQAGANLIPTNSQQLAMTLMPRTIGKFSRYGLKVNKLRYHRDGYTERYLRGDSATVAYNPDNVSCVWIIEKGTFIRFDIIAGRYSGKSLAGVQELKNGSKSLIRSAAPASTQARIDLATHISAISCNAAHRCDISTKNIRKTRQREQLRTHINYAKVGTDDEQY